jgi:hypothetical protein
MSKRKKKRPPIGRSLLEKLTRDMGMDERVVTDAEIDEWAAKLKAEPSHYRQGRIVMEKFLPWLSERLRQSTVRMVAGFAARHPGPN